jgi:hypothetical protein
MTGGIGIGGANAFWELFIKSDIPKAIASAVIGAGISYKKGSKKRKEYFFSRIKTCEV